MALSSELGPLEALVGTWEGDQGIDVAYNHATQKIRETPYRERTTFNAFGPVDNGKQVLFGLDYRTAAWKDDDVDPFHTEVGYWLWEPVTRTVMRCFMVPRGSTILAGGQADADATSFTMTAECGSNVFGVLSNPYLDTNAKCTHYSVTVTINADGSYSYEETTTLAMAHASEPVLHTDRNTLKRV
ncbi:MAG: heme-binding beta-barrel domain-containing protein [Acidimicrobiia bacterium]